MDRVAVFQEHRGLLFSIAYRMLGSASDAEDVVQDAFLRWREAPDDEIRSERAYLSTIVTRLAIDHLRSARSQRETYIGPWLPEPLLTDESIETRDPAALSESLSMAFLVLLDQLGAVERAVFLLHEVFDYDHAEIAAIIGKSEANCRQILKRARAHLTERRPRIEPAKEVHDQVFYEFLGAAASGNLSGLITLLADDVKLSSDGGGRTRAARNTVHGASRAARFIIGVLRKAPADATTRHTRVNGRPGMILYVGGRPYGVMTVDVCDGQITAIWIVVNPDKLRQIPPLQ